MVLPNEVHHNQNVVHGPVHFQNPVNIIAQVHDPYPPAAVTIGVLKEIYTNREEKRVAIPPAAAEQFRKAGYAVYVEQGAGGVSPGYQDDVYRNNGCSVTHRGGVINKSNVLVCIHAPPADQFKHFRNKTVVCWLGRALPYAKDIMTAATWNNVTLIDVTSVPRLDKYQRMDFQSKQAHVIGHRAVMEAINCFDSEGPRETMVLGCGEAGMEAIKLAKSFGHQVRCWDARPLHDKVKEAGGEFLPYGFPQKKLLLDNIRECDIVICTITLSIPGRVAPTLIDDEMVAAMPTGAVIVDVAAVGGGNCTKTVKGTKITAGTNKVVIVGYDDLASRATEKGSNAYASCLYNLLDHITGPEGPSNLFPAIEAAMNDADDGDYLIRRIVCSEPKKQEQSA